jgi:hypothetical protein
MVHGFAGRHPSCSGKIGRTYGRSGQGVWGGGRTSRKPRNPPAASQESDYRILTEYTLAREALESGMQALLVSGGAGTGKSASVYTSCCVTRRCRRYPSGSYR